MENNTTVEYGIKVLYDPVQQDATRGCMIDIVAIHGLGADPDETWVWKKDGCNWLNDPEKLPKVFPYARIMRFGYKSDWLGTQHDSEREHRKTKVADVAEMLVTELLVSRSEEDPTRPVILIAHSYGGLVLLEALRNIYDEEENRKSFLSFVAGLLFFGTPFRGRRNVILEEIGGAMEEGSEMEKDWVAYPETMGLSVKGNESLDDIVKKYLETREEFPIPLWCFYETEPSPIRKGIRSKKLTDCVLVPKVSACLDMSLGVEHQGLYRRHHYNLQKFPREDDVAYRAVKHEMEKLVNLAKKKYHRAEYSVVIDPQGQASPISDTEGQGKSDTISQNGDDQDDEDIDDTYVDDNQDDEDSDDTDVESILSNHSKPSSRSSIQPPHEIYLAASELANLLFEVEELNQLLTIAYAKVGKERFARNIRKLLISWGRKLQTEKSEVSGDLQHQVAQFVQRSAQVTAYELERRLANDPGSHPFQLQDLQVDKSRRLNDWIESFSNIPRSQDPDTKKNTPLKPSNVSNDDDINDSEGTQDSSDEDIEEHSDDGDSNENISLEATKTFLRNSKALLELCTDLRHWLDGRLPKRTENSMNITLDSGAKVSAPDAKGRTEDVKNLSVEDDATKEVVAKDEIRDSDYLRQSYQSHQSEDADESVTKDLGAENQHGFDFEPDEPNNTIVPVARSRSAFPNLPAFVDKVFDAVMPCHCEPPVPGGMQRVRWACDHCGTNLFQDVEMATPDPLRDLETQVQANNLGQSGRLVRLKYVTTQIAIEAWKLMSGVLRPGPTTSENTERRRRQATQSELRLLLCVDIGDVETRLLQPEIHHVNNDCELFDYLRQIYYKNQSSCRWFTLRSVNSLHLRRFKLDFSDYTETHAHENHCQPPECICLPPIEVVGPDKQYLCEPAPRKPLHGNGPAIDPRRLTHNFYCLGGAKGGQKTILDQLPKRTCGKLCATEHREELGWGIHFEEGWHWRTINLLMIFFSFSSCIFGIAWSFARGDMGGAFTVSAWWIALGAGLISCLALRSKT